MFLSEPEKQKIFVTSILFENIFIKKAIVKHLSNFTHFQILSKTSFTSHMFFLICFERRGIYVMYLYYRLQAMLANLLLAKDCFCRMATKAPLELLVTKH